MTKITDCYDLRSFERWVHYPCRIRDLPLLVLARVRDWWVEHGVPWDERGCLIDSLRTLVNSEEWSHRDPTEQVHGHMLLVTFYCPLPPDQIPSGAITIGFEFNDWPCLIKDTEELEAATIDRCIGESCCFGFCSSVYVFNFEPHTVKHLHPLWARPGSRCRAWMGMNDMLMVAGHRWYRCCPHRGMGIARRWYESRAPRRVRGATPSRSRAS